MEAKCLFDFVTDNPDELSFKKGNILKIVGVEGEGHWAKAELDGKEGSVPKNYIKMMEEDPPWFKPGLTRSGAEDLLKAQPHDGAFFVRESESSPGDFSISVKFENQVQHFKVLRDGNGKYFLWISKFNSLNQLVNHHRSYSVSKEQTILLRDPVTSSAPPHIVTAKYQFDGQDSSELSLRKGDRIEVIDKTDDNWWMGKNLRSNMKGLFPVPYVNVQ